MNTLSSTEIYSLKWFIVCYVNFTSEKKTTVKLKRKKKS